MRYLIALSLAGLVVAGCGAEDAGQTDAGTDIAQIAAKPASDAMFEHNGRRYELAVVGECGTRDDGTFGTWAFTLGADGKPVLEGPQLLAQSGDNWSVIDFHPGGSGAIVRVYREGRERFGFEDGVLEFDGELGAGNRERARARIACPSSAITSTDAT